VDKVRTKGDAGRLDLRKTFYTLQTQMIARLYTHRVTVTHSGTKGDVTEANWIQLFNDYLPERYRTAKAFVVDSTGRYSDQIDVVVFDRQYSPFLFNQDGAMYVPAESVYAVFEVKQLLDQAALDDACQRVGSVRRLVRTTAPITHAGGVFSPKKPFMILGGFLGLYSAWSDPFGDRFTAGMKKMHAEHRLDLGCILEREAVEARYPEGGEAVFERVARDEALIFFFLRLLKRLQMVGTVPAMDLAVYEACLREG
jgi:hypothetical protein